MPFKLIEDISEAPDQLKEITLKELKTMKDPMFILSHKKFYGSLKRHISKLRKYLDKHEDTLVYVLTSQNKPSKKYTALYDLLNRNGASITLPTISYAMESVAEEAMVFPSVSLRTLEDLMKQSSETFSEMLLRLIQERGMKNSEAYQKANLDKKHFSKIKNNKNYSPSKKTVFAFALALELSLDETKDLLNAAGYSLSNSFDLDIAMKYFIENQIYDIYEVEIVLYDLGLDSLCRY